MRNGVFNLISEYAKWVLINYQAIAKFNATMPALRLISKENNKKTGEVCFKIHISGKNIFPILSLNDLNHDTTISNFSKEDQNVIRSYLSGKQQVSKRIVARTYDRETKQFVYTIKSFD